MNITIVTQYFPPEICAIRPYELAKEWASEGIMVDVVTAFPNHPVGIVDKEYRGKAYLKEIISGIDVHRNYIFARPGLLGRALSDITFAISSVLISTFKVRKPDYVIASSPSFFSVVSGYVISRIRGAKFIFEVRDLWPAVMKSLGIVKIPLIYKLLENVEMFFYRHSYKVIVVTESFKRDIVSRGICADKVEVVTNGFDSSLFFPRPCNQGIIERYKLNNKFVVGYIGNHGISQALEQFIHAAEKLKEQDDIVFVLVGDGTQKTKLKELASKLKLDNVKFISAKPKSEIAEYICSCDVVYVSLKDLEVYDAFIPSKIYDVMACGRPILAALRGEAEEVLRSSGSAVIIPPGDADEVAKAIMELKQNDALRECLASNGPDFLGNSYSRARLAQQYLAKLQSN